MDINYVSLLYEKCAKASLPPPTFREDDNSVQGMYKCFYIYNDWAVHGLGQSKKKAKQQAAKSMLEKLIEERVFGKNKTAPVHSDDAPKNYVMIVNEYCSINKKEPAKYFEKEKEGDFFVCECTLEDFTAKGKGRSKRDAKENAADKVVKHFDIQNYYEDLKTLKVGQKNAIANLHEYCQKQKVSLNFIEEKIGTEFVVSCIVGESLAKSSANASKKKAKLEASEMMLNMLKEKNNLNTPSTSPIRDSEDFTRSCKLTLSTLKPSVSSQINNIKQNTNGLQKSESTENSNPKSQPQANQGIKTLAPINSDTKSSNANSSSKRPFLPSFLFDDEESNDYPQKRKYLNLLIHSL